MDFVRCNGTSEREPLGCSPRHGMVEVPSYRWPSPEKIWKGFSKTMGLEINVF